MVTLPNPKYNMPATDDDTIQRLFSEIFDKDMDQFREYAEADDGWNNLVTLLDENNGAGWVDPLVPSKPVLTLHYIRVNLTKWPIRLLHYTV